MFSTERGRNELMWHQAAQWLASAARYPGQTVLSTVRLARVAPSLVLVLLGMASQGYAAAPSSPDDADIHLELSPRICTLAARDKQCQTEVHAQWSSPHEESLCLVILDRPEVKRCWEHYSQGTYSLELTFVDDLTFQLRDTGSQNVLASEVLRVIREALHYRHKRREPWNIFD